MAIENSLSLFFTVLLLISGTNAINLIVKNNCPFTIWPGTLTGSGPALSTTGFELAQGDSNTISAEPSWSGRIWARTQCSTLGNFVCATADCASGEVACNGAGANPPATLVEFTVNGDGNKDFYDVSLVDGFNLPVSIVPSSQACPMTSCSADVNKVCPSELAVNNNGEVVACKSACLALNEPQYCCTDDHNTAPTCPPTNYSMIFKEQCPEAYSYAYDDATSTFTCPSGSSDYTITFCP